MQKELSTAPVAGNHFGTAHLLDNLKHRTISSGIVRVGTQGMQFVLMLGYNIVLARLLSPQDFGLVAMVMTIVGFLQIFRDLGLSTATIQRDDINHAQVSNLFWINVLVSGVISVAMAVGSPLIAWFYHQPRLINISLALCGSFLMNGLTVQHLALLNRQMRFVVTSVIELSSVAVSLGVGIGLAIAGYGYWSLVIATLVQSLVRMILAWSVSKWRPQRPVRGVGTRPLVTFGANLTVSGLIYSVSRGCDSLLIGRVFGSDALGFYTRAAALLARPIEQLISPILTVVVPALSRLQGQPERYRRFYLQIFEAMTIAGFFFAGLCVPLANPITVTVLGGRWEAAGPIFGALSLSAIFVPLSAAASWLYTSQGRGKDMLKVCTFFAIVMVLSVSVGLPFGPAAVALAFSLSGIVLQLPFTFYLAGSRGPVSTRDLWQSFGKHLPVAIGVGGITWLAHSFTGQWTPFQQLLMCGTIGVLSGAAIIFISPPSRNACMRLITVVRDMKK